MRNHHSTFMQLFVARIPRLACFALCALALAACEPKRNPSAEPPRFREIPYVINPHCASEPEVAYVALGETVFKFHALAHDEPGRGIAVHPVAEVPMGSKTAWCKESPVSAKSVYLTNEQGDYIPKGRHTKALHKLGLTYVENRVDWLRKLLEDSAKEDLKEGMCKVEFELYMCGTSTVSTYTGDRSGYFTPTGESFIIECGMGPSISPDYCKVRYSLNNEISIYYDFYRRPSPESSTHMAIKDALIFDRSIRENILQQITISEFLTSKK